MVETAGPAGDEGGGGGEMTKNTWQRWGWVVLAAPLALGIATVQDAGAIVVCQKKNKVKVRPDVCKKKETLVLDLTMALGDQDTRVGDVEGNVDDVAQDVAELQGILGVECRDDPARVLSIGPEQGGEDSCLGGGCRSLDGDQAACDGAYQVDRSRGASSCAFIEGKCLSCGNCAQAYDRCLDACETPSCPGDPTRTNFVGGPNEPACPSIDNESDCALAWAIGGTEPVTCYWDLDAARCQGCGNQNERNGLCMNDCREAAVCADATRTVFAGGPGSEGCGAYDGDQPACESAWHRGNSGVASCWYDTGSGDCSGCGLPNQLRESCDNTCE
jgi:hypothetical protein